MNELPWQQTLVITCTYVALWINPEVTPGVSRTCQLPDFILEASGLQNSKMFFSTAEAWENIFLPLASSFLTLSFFSTWFLIVFQGQTRCTGPGKRRGYCLVNAILPLFSDFCLGFSYLLPNAVFVFFYPLLGSIRKSTLIGNLKCLTTSYSVSIFTPDGCTGV